MSPLHPPPRPGLPHPASRIPHPTRGWGGTEPGMEPDLTGELGQPVPGRNQPPVLLLQELPLLAGVAAFPQEPAVLLLVLQQLEHGLLQLAAE